MFTVDVKQQNKQNKQAQIESANAGGCSDIHVQVFVSTCNNSWGVAEINAAFA